MKKLNILLYTYNIHGTCIIRRPSQSSLRGMERFEAFKVKWDITFYTEIRCFGIFLAIFTAICVIPSLLTFCSRSRLHSHLLPRSKRPCGGGLLKPLFYPAQPMKILLTPDIPYPRRRLIQEDLG